MSESQPPVDDLFGDEDLPLEGEPLGRDDGRRRGALWIAVAAGVVLFAALFWWLSARNHDRYSVVLENDVVHVERGMFFPFGSSEWHPNRAYDPIKLPAGVAPEKTGSMTVEEAEEVLLQLFIAVATHELKDLDAGDPELAEKMLLRAWKLDHTEPDDDRRLLQLLGDVNFRRGLSEVRGVQSRFDEAQKQFRMAQQRGGVTYQGADKWVTAIEDLRDKFRQLTLDSGLDPDRILADPDLAPKKDKGPAQQ